MIQRSCANYTHPRASRQGKFFRFKFHYVGFSFPKFPQGTIEIFIFKIQPRNSRNFHFERAENSFSILILTHLPPIVNFIPLSWKIV